MSNHNMTRVAPAGTRTVAASTRDVAASARNVAAPTRGERSTARQRGFSFIEILIVMGIISVLVGGVIVAINMWVQKGPEFATKNTITKTKALIEDWERNFEMLPPSDVTKIGMVTGSDIKAQKPDNTYNEGIEAVYQALFWPGFKSTDFGGDELGNTDEDELKKAVSKAGVKLMEIRDAWGSPLVYFHRDDYGKYQEDGPVYLNFRGDDVRPKPWRNEANELYNPSSFQIFSMGPDGEPNTEDDITPWSRD